MRGQEYKRYTYDIAPYYDAPNYARLFLGTEEKRGSFRIYYWAELEGTRSVERVIPVEIIRIPPARVAQRFKFIMGADYDLLRNYPERKRNIRHLGINSLLLNYNVPAPERGVTAEEVGVFLDELRAEGFSTGTMGSGFFLPPYGQNPELQAINIQGEKVNRFDFTARGPWMDEVAELPIRSAGEPGFCFMVSNFEPYFRGRSLSFTERTVSKFKTYFLKNHRHLRYVNPRRVARDPRRYPEHNRIWTDFKCRQFADYMYEVVKRVRKVHPQLKIGLTSFPGVSEEEIKATHLFDQTLLSTFLDFNMPMLYNNLYRTMPKVHTQMDLAQELIKKGGRADFIPVLSLGFWGGRGPGLEAHNSSGRYQIYHPGSGYQWRPGILALPRLRRWRR